MGAVNHLRIQTSAFTEDDTAVAVNNDHLAAFESMLRVLPATKTVMVVIGNSPSEKLLREQTQRELMPLEGRIKLLYTNDLSFEEILKTAATLPPQSAIFWHLLAVDGAGLGHEGGTALTRVHNVANAPIFSYDDSFFGFLLGGPMQSVAEVSRRTASVAIRILGGEKAGDIKTPVSQFATPKYDWRELQRWGISESSLPPGSEIFFREPSVWEKYRLQIMAVFAALLLQTALISWLVYEHRRRHTAEVLARSHMSELQRMDRLATAAELSASIAHEVNQPLTGIATLASAALHWLARGKPDLDKMRDALTQILEASHSASELVTSVRAMFTKEQAKRVPLDINALIRSVLAVLRVELQKDGIEVQLQLDPGLPRVDGDRVQLQQVLVNLIKN